MLKFGVLGGTFNPIHYGHLLMAEQAREALKIGKIVFMPSGYPPHKDLKTVVSADDRMKMVEMAIHSNENFLASTIELDREGKSYTVDTLRELKAEYGQDTELFFIIGADVLIDLPNWRSIREVVKLCKFAAMQRPGFKKEEFNEQKRLLEEEYGAEIEVIDMPLIDISSTDIRNRLAEAKSIKYMLPENVIEYIEKEGLYL